MNAITTTIIFELDSRLSETATIQQDCNGFWGYTTNKGYNTWEGLEFKSFDIAYTDLKKYEKRNVKELKYA